MFQAGALESAQEGLGGGNILPFQFDRPNTPNLSAFQAEGFQGGRFEQLIGAFPVEAFQGEGFEGTNHYWPFVPSATTDLLGAYVRYLPIYAKKERMKG